MKLQCSAEDPLKQLGGLLGASRVACFTHDAYTITRVTLMRFVKRYVTSLEKTRFMRGQERTRKIRRRALPVGLFCPILYEHLKTTLFTLFAHFKNIFQSDFSDRLTVNAAFSLFEYSKSAVGSSSKCKRDNMWP